MATTSAAINQIESTAVPRRPPLNFPALSRYTFSTGDGSITRRKHGGFAFRSGFGVCAGGERVGGLRAGGGRGNCPEAQERRPRNQGPQSLRPIRQGQGRSLE